MIYLHDHFLEWDSFSLLLCDALGALRGVLWVDFHWDEILSQVVVSFLFAGCYVCIKVTDY